MDAPSSRWLRSGGTPILWGHSMGILCDIADAATGMAFANTLAPGESFTTIELKINFFRPVWVG